MSAIAAFTPNPKTPRRSALKRLGAKVWDETGEIRLDFDMGGGSVLLGHAQPKVEAAVTAARGCARDTAMAMEALAELAPCAEIVRFCAEETQALPAAIGAARKVTGHSRAVVFDENAPLDLEGLAAIVVDTLGASREHLVAAARMADAAGALLIFDEGASAFRVHERGAQGASGVIPHLAVFGAALANGRPLGAVAGQADLIAALDEHDLPRPREAAMAAASATLERLVLQPIAHQLSVLGSELQAEVQAMSQEAAADRFFNLGGDPSLPLPTFASPRLEGVWLQECARAGLICISAHGLCAAHIDADLSKLVSAYRTVLPILAARGMIDLLARQDSARSVSHLSGVS